MATELIPASGLTLVESTDQKQPSAAVLLKLSSTNVDQLKSSANGVQLVTGDGKSTLRYGGTTMELAFMPEDHTSDIFEFRAGNVLLRTTSVSYRAQRARSPAKEQDADEALLALKNSMAMLEQEKKAQEIHVANAVLPEPKNRWVAMKQQKKTSGLLAAEERVHLSSASRSPALAPTSQPSDITPRSRAMKKVVVHLLATKNMNMNEIASKTHIPEQELKKLLPSIGQLIEGRWKLLDRAYKELDIWRFKFTKEERSSARENAISAYGRLRLSNDDPLWQLLLPAGERGQGKVLSRLHLHAGASSSPRPASLHDEGHPASNVSTPRTTPASTPSVGAHKKSNSDIMKRLLSKDPKKARAAEEAKEKKRKERQSLDSEHESRATKRQANTASKKSSSTVKSAEFVYSSDDDQETTQVKSQASGTSQKKNSQLSAKTNGTSTDAKKVTPKPQSKQQTSPKSSNAAKTESKQPPRAQNRLGPSPRQNSPTKNNRPSVPSPLGAAQPRNASDVIDRSSVKLARRAADQPQGLGITNRPPRRRHDTVTSVDSSEEVSSNSSASMPKKSSDDNVAAVKALRPGSKAREAANARAAKAIAEIQAKDSRTTAKSNQPSENKSNLSNGVGDGHHRNSSSDDRRDGAYSDSSISVIDSITFNQGVELAQKFQEDYYPQYAKMYDSISDRQARGVSVSISETKKLWEMHERLKQMKREIEAASERQARDGDS